MKFTANRIRHQTLLRWNHRHYSRCHILRSQLGFNQVEPCRPKPCVGCINYHGQAYGQTQSNRTILICGFHPYGWIAGGNCPDWQGNQ